MAYDDLSQIDQYIRAKYPLYNYIHPDVLTVTTTVPASSSANLPIAASITESGVSANYFQVPQSWIMVVYDLYTRSSGDTATDATATFYKNSNKVMAISSPLSTQVVTNNTRPIIQTMIYLPQDKLTINEAPLAAAGTTTTTNTAFVNARIYDSSFSVSY